MEFHAKCHQHYFPNSIRDWGDGRAHSCDKIVEEVKAVNLHAILADEVTSQNTEHLALGVRFVDSHKNIQEEFLTFMPLKRITGEQVADTIISFPTTNDIQWYTRTGIWWRTQYVLQWSLCTAKNHSPTLSKLYRLLTTDITWTNLVTCMLIGILPIVLKSSR